jgi:hypothetical protein
MKKVLLTRMLMVGMMLAVFALGYVSGSTTQRRADAQGIGGLLDQAGKAAAMSGTASQLGSSVAEIQGHVDGLQKNLATLKQIQSVLGGVK